MTKCFLCGLALDVGTRRCPSCSADAETGEPLLIDGRYVVEREVGRGSMGVVYLARDHGLARSVAIKLIAPEHLRTAGAGDRFRREASALAAVRHENVVQVYALGTHDGAPFFAMEWVLGKPLDEVIRGYVLHDALVPVLLALQILGDVAKGLGAIHAAGLVHRDVKPANIVIEERTGRAVLLDLGLVKDVARDAPAMEVAGSPPYMAPEQIAPPRGSDGVTPAVDVYALACSAFELLTSRLPYEAASALGTMNLHLYEPIPRLSAVRPELADLDDALANAMEKRPQDRCSIVELARAFDDAAARRTGAAVSERATRRRLEDRDAAELAPSTSREPPSRAELAETLPDSLAAHLSILIVDDDPAMRSVLERAALKAFPDRRLDIVHAGSGAEALPAAARSLPDLILIDYDMPGMNGVDTLARLRGLEGGKHTPAIVVTGHSEETIRWRFELLGISDFLCKPVDFPSIVASLQAVVQSSRSSTQTVSPVLA